MWKSIVKKGYWELWQTPAKYLVCCRYTREFHFFDNFNEAREFLLRK